MLDPLAVPDNIIALWESFYGFVGMMVMLLGFIGATSRSLVISMWAAYLMFAYLAVSVDDALLEGILIVTLVLIFVGMAFKVWRAEGVGEV